MGGARMCHVQPAGRQGDLADAAVREEAGGSGREGPDARFSGRPVPSRMVACRPSRLPCPSRGRFCASSGKLPCAEERQCNYSAEPFRVPLACEPSLEV